MRCVPWKLPAVLESEETEDCNFQIPYDATHAALTVAKSKIAGYRRRHGARAWTHAVARVDGTHVFGGVRQPISRAYCKLIELIETCILPTPTASLHLCEAPGPPPPPPPARAPLAPFSPNTAWYTRCVVGTGGFVQATLEKFPLIQGVHIHSLLTDGAPQFSQILLHHPKTHVLRVSSGDITEASVWGQIRDEAETCDFITADGAVDSDSAPAHTEENNHRLLRCQVDTALAIQRPGGTFVVKVFGVSRPHTFLVLAQLCKSYASVYLTKPRSSRVVNDERYVVCVGFVKEHTYAVDVPTTWLSEMRYISSEFARTQLLAIEDALRADAHRRYTHYRRAT